MSVLENRRHRKAVKRNLKMINNWYAETTMVKHIGPRNTYGVISRRTGRILFEGTYRECQLFRG
jgi:hypothetical protein